MPLEKVTETLKGGKGSGNFGHGGRPGKRGGASPGGGKGKGKKGKKRSEKARISTVNSVVSKMNELEFSFGGTLDYDGKGGKIKASLPVHSERSAKDIAKESFSQLGFNPSTGGTFKKGNDTVTVKDISDREIEIEVH